MQEQRRNVCYSRSDSQGIDSGGNAVHLWLARENGAAMAWPAGGTAQAVYDHREREWRHLDTCQSETRPHARVPRVDCPTRGVLQIALPLATPGSHFMPLLERLAIAWLQTAATSAVAWHLGISWDEAWGIMRRAVARGLARRGALQALCANAHGSERACTSPL